MVTSSASPAVPSPVDMATWCSVYSCGSPLGIITVTRPRQRAVLLCGTPCPLPPHTTYLLACYRVCSPKAHDRQGKNFPAQVAGTLGPTEGGGSRCSTPTRLQLMVQVVESPPLQDGIGSSCPWGIVCVSPVLSNKVSLEAGVVVQRVNLPPMT